MLARDIMTSPAITVGPDTSARETARLLVLHRISAVLVVDDRHHVVGMVSESDLMRRREIGTEPHHPWWLAFFANPVSIDEQYHKAIADAVAEIMTRHVVTVSEDTSIIKIAEILAERHIKRVPVVRDHACVGVVSRADLVRAFSRLGEDKVSAPAPGDLRERVLDKLREKHITSPATFNLIVEDGVVDIWGTIIDEAMLIPLIDAIKSVPGVKVVHDHIAILPPMWAE